MVKRFAMYTVPEGTNPDEVWNYFTKGHAPTFAKMAGAGLKRYILNRVTRVVTGPPKFTILAEMWWENEEVMNKAIETARVTKSPHGYTFKEDLQPHEAVDRFITIVEECVIKE